MRVERQKERDLAGKVVLITGASRGMGKQAALGFARRGANLVIAARTVEPDGTLPGSLGETVREIEALGAGVLAVQADLAKEADLKKLVDAAVARFGGIDILINNGAATTGEMWAKGFLQLTREEWLYQFDVNTHAPFTLMQLVAPIMGARGGGRIINITTGSAEALRLPEEPRAAESVGAFNLTVPGYFASKRAMDRLGNVIAPELARLNIAVIGLHPGLVQTELVDIRVKEHGLDNSTAVPMATPARMMIYFAACEDAREYSGRIFFAEREMAAMGIEPDQ
jgi:NAD(P)-dependent dehydrogenase (short-subunit alcohol dehydrogenase family)